MSQIISFLVDLLDLKLMKRVLMGLSSLVFILIFLDQVSFSLRSSRILNSRSSLDKDFPLSSSALKLEPLQTFQEVIQRRNLFNVAHQKQVGELRKNTIQDLVKDFRLKGIANFGEREAILEDAKTKQTLFVKKGEKLQEITIKEIKSDALVLSYEGEDTELRIAGDS